MYLPRHFREERLDHLHAFIERHPLAALITSTDGRPDANHMPLLLVRQPDRLGTLRGHVARGNPLWRTTAEGSEVLVLFGGADAYVSPSWYATKRATGKVVPTWNYAVVHVRGRIRFFDDPEWLHTLVSSLTDRFEKPRPEPWAVTDAPTDYIQAQLRAIVGLEIEILDITGKFKASQNRPDADRDGVAAGLRETGEAGLDELVRDPEPAQPVSMWYAASLGDLLTAQDARARIQEEFALIAEAAGRPSDMAVLGRVDSEGRLHCELTVYFPPRLAELARRFDARPCAQPPRAGLELLAGDGRCWTALFPPSPDSSVPEQ
jgi:transcriptional regulator